jgi:hypothetical protein
MTSRIRLAEWRDDWQGLTDPPDARDHEREQTFLRDHAHYGARIHSEVVEALAGALEGARSTARRHTLFLRLFAEYVNAHESLGAWGWSLQRRNEFRLFLDGFLAYPHQAPAAFFESVLASGGNLIELLRLPERAAVIRSIREQLPVASARAAGKDLDTLMHNMKQAAEQYFTHDSVLLTHYNKAKHGATMLRLAKYTEDELDFQVIAPQLDRSSASEGARYDIAKFRASPEMVDLIRSNTVIVTNSIRALSFLAWALYQAELFYETPTV